MDAIITPYSCYYRTSFDNIILSCYNFGNIEVGGPTVHIMIFVSDFFL